MRKLLLSLFVCSFLFLGLSIARAENSASSYDGNYWSQQVFVTAYNNSASSIAINNVVVLDTTATAGTTLGGYVTTNGSTTDSVFVFGVTDETIAAGTLGRICVRGPHKVVAPSPTSGITSGNTMGACASSSQMCPVTTSSGTDRGFLGKIINTTATTGTNDAANTFWIWVEPGVAN